MLAGLFAETLCGDIIAAQCTLSSYRQRLIRVSGRNSGAIEVLKRFWNGIRTGVARLV